MRKLNLLAAVFLAAATSIVLPATAAEAACPVPADRDINVTRVVYQTGNELHVSDKVMLAGFEAGWVESHMNNLPCGDADSLGVFQQRPSQGWGTPAQIMDVHFASNSFFTRAINSERAHPGFTAGQIAQDVQRSAFPDRYDAARAKAQALLDEVKVVPPPARVRSVVTATGGQEFGIGPDGHVMSTFWSASIGDNGGWHAWFAIPTGYGDGVTAVNASVTVTTLNGQTQLFTTAADGRVISTFWSPTIPTNGGWHEWFAIPTGFYDGKTAPNAVITASGGQLFTTAPDGHVMSTFWSPDITDNGGWHAWFAIPTGFADGVTAANATVSMTTLNNQTQLFTTANDGHVISTYWSGIIPTNGGWHEWFAIPTGFYDGKTAPNAVITANGGQLFTTAPDGHVMSTFWSPDITDNGGWHAWFAIPTGFADGVAAGNTAVSVASINSKTQLFTVAADGHVMSTFWSADIPTNGGWHAWFAIPTGLADGRTAAASRVGATTLNDQPQLFTAAPDGHVMSTFWSPSITTNGGWHEWFAIPTGFYDGKIRT